MSSIGGVGSSAFPSVAGAGNSSAVLEAQLARYQVQLADWVSCPSCNTPEGKAKIQELSDKVRETQQSIDAAAPLRQGSPSTALSLNVVGAVGGPSPSPVSATGTVGTVINVLA